MKTYGIKKRWAESWEWLCRIKDKEVCGVDQEDIENLVDITLHLMAKVMQADFKDSHVCVRLNGVGCGYPECERTFEEWLKAAEKHLGELSYANSFQKIQ